MADEVITEWMRLTQAQSDGAEGQWTALMSTTTHPATGWRHRDTDARRPRTPARAVAVETGMIVKKEKVLRQLKKAVGRDFVAGGKFAPRGVTSGLVLGGALGSVVAARVGREIAKRKGGIELPRVLYLALTEDDVYLVEGRYGLTVTPKQVLVVWPRSSVRATRKGGIRSVGVELVVEGVEQPVRLRFGRADSSAEEVVRLLAG
jgi:hypothetical protein